MFTDIDLFKLACLQQVKQIVYFIWTDSLNYILRATVTDK